MGDGRVGRIADIVADEPETGREDADDAIFRGRVTGGRGADANGCSENARSGAESIPPEAVSDHDDALAAGAEIVGRKHAAERRPDANGVERTGGAFQCRNLLWVIVGVQDEAAHTRVVGDFERG